MNPKVRLVEETKTFVRENLPTICKEYSDWQKTEKLPDGLFREAASKLNYVTSIGSYGKNSYVSGKLNIIESMMFDCLLNEHLHRAGFFGENI